MVNFQFNVIILAFRLVSPCTALACSVAQLDDTFAMFEHVTNWL
jgi:hypothetical protein